MVAVEDVGRVEVADVVGSTVSLSGLDGLAQQGVVSDGSEGAGQVELLGPVGVGAGALTQDDVIQLDVLLDGTGGADTDDVLNAVAVEQLVGVDADGGHTHAGGHDGNLDALVGAGVTLNTTDVIHQDGVLQEVLSDELGAQGIAGHEDGLAEVAVLGIDVGSGDLEFHNGASCCLY